MPMSKQQKGLVPELRFPEFEKEPNWPCVQLNAVAKRSTSKNKGEKVSRVLTNSAVDGVVDQRDYFEKDIAVKGNLESYYIVDKGDYVYNPRISSTAPVGPISKNKVGKGVMSPLYTVFKFNSKKNDFFEQFFKSSRWHGYLQTISNSGARHDRMSITSSEFMAMPVPNPSDMEQQKIADCLTSIDELIALHTQKLDALKDHKKGLMQQLFPAEGEAVPKLRFPEFRNKGTWKEVTLGDIAEIKLGKMLDKKKHTTGQLLPYLNNLAVRWNRINIEDLPKMYFDDNELARFGLKAGDVVVCEGGEPGRAAVWDGRLSDLKYQKAIHRVRFRTTFEPSFLVLHLENISGTAKFEMLFTGGGIKHLTQESFSKLKIPYAPHPEQKKISDFFFNVEELISYEERRLENLGIHKKGLMQKLFPVMDDAV